MRRKNEWEREKKNLLREPIERRQHRSRSKSEKVIEHTRFSKHKRKDFSRHAPAFLHPFCFFSFPRALLSLALNGVTINRATGMKTWASCRSPTCAAIHSHTRVYRRKRCLSLVKFNRVPKIIPPEIVQPHKMHA